MSSDHHDSELAPDQITMVRDWTLIQHGIDRLSQGICVFNADFRLALFNRNFLDLLEYPEELIRIGLPFEELLRFNAERGEFGPGDTETLIRERLELVRHATEPHCFERTRPNGTVLEISGGPLPGGGFVSIYTDISHRKTLEDRLRFMATRDNLTGLFNRGHFFELAEQELERARRHGHPISIVMLDVDHFKQFNDRYGHATGDEVLRSLADTLKKGLRSHDIPARFGGEEFLALLPETDHEEAFDVAERLRQRVEASPLRSDEHGTLTITASLGVSSGHGDELPPLDRLIESADQGLYASKKVGRNRVSRVDTGLGAT